MGHFLRLNYFKLFSLNRMVAFSTILMRKALSERVRCTILYATETGKSERFAKVLQEIFAYAFDPKVFKNKASLFQILYSSFKT
jgi:hypothetical protein